MSGARNQVECSRVFVKKRPDLLKQNGGTLKGISYSILRHVAGVDLQGNPTGNMVPLVAEEAAGQSLFEQFMGEQMMMPNVAIAEVEDHEEQDQLMESGDSAQAQTSEVLAQIASLAASNQMLADDVRRLQGEHERRLQAESEVAHLRAELEQRRRVPHSGEGVVMTKILDGTDTTGGRCCWNRSSRVSHKPIPTRSITTASPRSNS